MKKIFFLTSLISTVIIYSTCSAQYWSKTYGGSNDDYARSIQQTTDGGYIVAGETYSIGTGEYNDMWILKLDGSGNITWQKTYGGSSYDRAYSIHQTSDEGYIVAGETYSFGVGHSDLWVLKLDSDGEITWQRTYAANAWECANAVRQTMDGGFIVAGYTDTLQHDSNFWVLKLDSSGEIMWEKTGDIETAQSIQQTLDGGYIVAGSTYGGVWSAWLLRLDESGNFIWQKIYQVGDFGGYTTRFKAVQLTSDGKYIVVGHTAPQKAPYNLVLMKLDSNGNVLWQRVYTGYDTDIAYSVQETFDGGYVVAGYTEQGDEEGNVRLLKFDSSGNCLWQKTYGGSGGENATSIQQSLDGGYVVAGYTESFGTGNFDAWVLKLDSSGVIPGCDIIYTDELSLIDTTVSSDDVNLSITPPGTVTSNTIVTPKLLAAETSLVCCHSPEDFDSDGIGDMCDNCLAVPNLLQDDSYPPQGNGIGDACDCEGNFNCFLDQDVDGSDAATLKSHFGRSTFQRPCIAEDPCNGDFNCDGDVDGTDASLFKSDFGRSSIQNPCPACVVGEWCGY